MLLPEWACSLSMYKTIYDRLQLFKAPAKHLLLWLRVRCCILLSHQQAKNSKSPQIISNVAVFYPLLGFSLGNARDSMLINRIYLCGKHWKIALAEMILFCLAILNVKYNISEIVAFGGYVKRCVGCFHLSSCRWGLGNHRLSLKVPNIVVIVSEDLWLSGQRRLTVLSLLNCFILLPWNSKTPNSMLSKIEVILFGIILLPWSIEWAVQKQNEEFYEGAKCCK